MLVDDHVEQRILICVLIHVILIIILIVVVITMSLIELVVARGRRARGDANS